MAAIAALGQGDDVFARLRHALAGSGEGELAARDLAVRNFAPIQKMLAQRASIDVPERAELTSLEGAVAFLAGDMRAAVADFEKAAELAPLQDNDAFTLAMALVNLGQDKEAGSVLSDLAGKHPEQALYVYWLGRLDYDLRRYTEAVDKLQKAVELDPKSARAWDSLGLAFDMQGQMERALKAFTEAANLNRNLQHPSAWPPHNLGYCRLRMNQPKEAEIALRESVRYDPKLAQAHYHLARALEEQQRQEEAIPEYKLAISEDTSSSDACYSLAMLYRKLHREAEANFMFAEYKKRKAEAR